MSFSQIYCISPAFCACFRYLTPFSCSVAYHDLYFDATLLSGHIHELSCFFLILCGIACCNAYFDTWHDIQKMRILGPQLVKSTFPGISPVFDSCNPARPTEVYFRIGSCVDGDEPARPGIYREAARLLVYEPYYCSTRSLPMNGLTLQWYSI